MLCRSVRDPRGADMKSHTVYKTFQTAQRREFVRITEDVQGAVREADISEGMVLVSAMHITAAVWINDDEPGIQADALEWLDKLAPPSWQEPDGEVARELLPNPGDYRHHRGGEDNGDAHLKNLGRAAAGELVRCGASVVIAGRREDVLETAANEIGERCSWRSGDIRTPEGARGIVRAALERHARLDFVLNNVGGQYFVPAES